MARKRKIEEKSQVAPVEDARILKTTSKAAKGIVPTQDDIRARAFELYEASGRMPGRDLENWVQAEQELVGER